MTAASTHTSSALPSTNLSASRDIDAEISRTERQVQLIHFLLAHQRSIVHSDGAIHEAKRQNNFRNKGISDVTETRLDATQQEVEAWLAQMRSMVRGVEGEGVRGQDKERREGGGWWGGGCIGFESCRRLCGDSQRISSLEQRRAYIRRCGTSGLPCVDVAT